jgi:hypothetical protein
MSTEMNLVRAFMVSAEGTPEDLDKARSVLDEAMALEASPPVVVSRMTTEKRGHGHGRGSLRWKVAIVAVAAAVIGGAVLVIAPSTRTPEPPAAAAEIARLADAVPPVPALAPGQWYQYQLHGALSATVTSGTKASPITATASIPIAIGEWSNSDTAVCTSQQFGTATFATPASAQAWQTMGLIATPANQPATGCSAGIEASDGGGGTPLGPIDVSNITHDPTTLATELQDGTTGISAIDRYASQEPAPLVGFLRLTDLLVGPLKGQWSGFGQEMLETMALLPGISSLGTMTSHSGAQGLAFTMSDKFVPGPSSDAASSSFTPPTVILDSQNGTLLEGRNLDYPVLGSAAQDFVGSSSALVYSDGVSYGTNAEWIDPVSGLQVIGGGSIPTWINNFHIIEAVTPASTTEAELSRVIDPLLGHGNSSFSDGGTPALGETTYDITIMGPLSTAQSATDTLTSSGLFTSVSLRL